MRAATHDCTGNFLPHGPLERIVRLEALDSEALRGFARFAQGLGVQSKTHRNDPDQLRQLREDPKTEWLYY